jgi:hypothetical protein
MKERSPMMMPRIAILILAGLSSGSAVAGWLDPPRPEAFLRAEDRARARLLDTPCTKADIGRGCYLYRGQALREQPCASRDAAQTIITRPTDQCYRMEPARRHRGVWVDAFEGQAFVPEGTTPPQWPDCGARSPHCREQHERAQAARIWIDVSRARLSPGYRRGGHRWMIEFVGRKTLYPGSYGHMGMSGHEIIVDRLISLEEVK